MALFQLTTQICHFLTRDNITIVQVFKKIFHLRNKILVREKHSKFHEFSIFSYKLLHYISKYRNIRYINTGQNSP